PELLHRADHRRGALPLQYLRLGLMRRLAGLGPAHRVLEQRRAFLEPDRREALRASGDRRRAGSAAGGRVAAAVVPAPALLGRTAGLLAPGRGGRPGWARGPRTTRHGRGARAQTPEPRIRQP